MKKSICIILPGWLTKTTGGAELQCYLLSEYLSSHNFYIEIFTLKGNFYSLEYYNYKLKYIYYKHYRSRFLTFISVLQKFFQTKSNVFLIRTDERILRGACRLYTRISNKKIIYSLASDHDALSKPLTLDIKVKSVTTLFKFVDCWFTELLLSGNMNVDLIITQTQKQYILLGGKVKKITIANSFIIPKDVDLSLKKNIVIWVGNIRDLKDVENVKQPEIFLRLAKFFSDSNWMFIMAGKGTDSIISSQPNFKSLGEINRSEMEKLYRKSKVYINTSKCEGFPNTFIEAALYKCLIISLKIDIDEKLQNNDLGFLCNNDFEKMRSFLYWTVSKYNDDEIQNKIKRCSEYFQNEVNMEINFSKYLNEINSLQ